jgi:hypothetical protein
MRHCNITADKRTTKAPTLCGWQSLRRVGSGCRFGRVAFQAMSHGVNTRLRSLTVVPARKFASACGDANTPVTASAAVTGWGYEDLALGHDVECDLDVDVRVYLQRDRVTSGRFDVPLGQSHDPLVEVRPAGFPDRGDDRGRGHRTEQLA